MNGNFKVKVVGGPMAYSGETPYYVLGKVYEVKNGILINELGEKDCKPNIKDIKDLNNSHIIQFELVKENIIDRIISGEEIDVGELTINEFYDINNYYNKKMKKNYYMIVDLKAEIKVIIQYIKNYNEQKQEKKPRLCLRGLSTNTFYGFLGDKTDLTDLFENRLCIGDTVIVSKNLNELQLNKNCTNIIANTEQYKDFIMGWGKIPENSKKGILRLEPYYKKQVYCLVKSWQDLKVGDKHNDLIVCEE